MIKDNLYHYRAIVSSVNDGDTCTVDIDLGLGTWVRNEKLRLSRINAPEIRGIERMAGVVSRDFLRNQINGKEVFVQTIKDKRGKYSHYLAEVWLKSQSNGWINVNDLMVNAGQAVYKDY